MLIYIAWCLSDYVFCILPRTASMRTAAVRIPQHHGFVTTMHANRSIVYQNF